MQCGYYKEIDERDKSKLLPFRLMDSAERDLRMAAAQTRYDAAKRLVGYEDGQSMSPPRLELRDGPDGGEMVVVEWSAPEAVMRRCRHLAAAEQPEGEAQGEAQGEPQAEVDGEADGGAQGGAQDEVQGQAQGATQGAAQGATQGATPGAPPLAGVELTRARQQQLQWAAFAS